MRISKERAHEKTAQRLTDILLRINRGEVLSRDSLMREYRVSERTIYRDLNRLGALFERQADGCYRLSRVYEGKLSLADLEVFARMTGVDSLFPNTSPLFLASLLSSQVGSSFLIKPLKYEKPEAAEDIFQKLQQAIHQRRICECLYKAKQRLLEPYRLVNQRGIWYLAATDHGTLKAFCLGKIEALRIKQDNFVPDQAISLSIEKEEDIWYSAEKFDVELIVSPNVKSFFERRVILPEQKNLGVHESGWLRVQCRASHPRQILPEILYWLPEIKIVAPDYLRSMLFEQLNHYLTIQTQGESHE